MKTALEVPQNTITALEISQNLPMRVISLKGMSKGHIIRFTEVINVEGKEWQLRGKTIDGKISILALQPYARYGLISISNLVNKKGV